jgi:hypothetical protein
MDEKHIKAAQLENGIYEFVTQSNSRATVDAFFAALSEVMESYPKDKTFRYIVDMRKNDFPPFAYFIERNRAWAATNSAILPTRMVLLVPITNPFRSLIFSLLPVIVRTANRPLKVSIFDVKERDNAIFWLMSER